MEGVTGGGELPIGAATADTRVHVGAGGSPCNTQGLGRGTGRHYEWWACRPAGGQGAGGGVEGFPEAGGARPN